VTNFALKSSVSEEVSQKTRMGGDTIPPSQPQMYPPVITGNSVKLIWSASPDSDWAAYYIYYSTSPIFESNALSLVDTIQTLTDTTFTVQNLRPATNYYFQVRSQDKNGNFSPQQGNF